MFVAPFFELIAPLLLVALIIFPGPDRENPRLFRLFPWLLVLSFVAAAFVMVAEKLQLQVFPAGFEKPSEADLWINLLFSLPLAWGFIQRKSWFRPLLIMTLVISTGQDLFDFFKGKQDTMALLSLVESIGSEFCLSIYLCLKFRPERALEPQPGSQLESVVVPENAVRVSRAEI